MATWRKLNVTFSSLTFLSGHRIFFSTVVPSEKLGNFGIKFGGRQADNHLEWWPVTLKPCGLQAIVFLTK